MADIAGVTNGRDRWSRDIPRHRHETAYAAIVLSGGYEECGSRGRFRVGPGDVLLHDAFDAHLDRFHRAGAEILNIVLPPGCDISYSLGAIADVDAIVRTAERDMRDAGAALTEQMARREIRVRDWPDFLADHLLSTPDCRLGEWAEEHGLALETISRGFGRVFGVTPAAFRAEARALRALRRILRDPAPLADIALASGFADQPHMSRAIKALTGATPRSWRTQSNPFKTEMTGSA